MGGIDGEALAGTLTRLIDQIDAGDLAAQAEFCELVYNELRVIARRHRRRSGQQSLETTEVVHEFFGRILSDQRLGQMKNRRLFYAAAAGEMRRLLIDHWRQQQALKRGGNLNRRELDPYLDELTDSVASRCGGDLEALDAALSRLKSEYPRQSEVVELKFFADLTNDQVAEALGISVDSVKRDWRFARAQLGARLSDE